MKVSLTPSWVHKASPFLVAAFASIAAWHWTDIVDAKTASEVVAGLGIAKFVLEWLTKSETVESVTPSGPSEG